VRILRARRTAGFVYLLVRCRCGKQFGHRAERRFMVCLQCGRIAEAARAPRARAAARWYHPPAPAAPPRRATGDSPRAPSPS
jgi:hypothetical protein